MLVGACDESIGPIAPATTAIDASVGSNVTAGSAIQPQIALGGYHTCALKADGTLSCWGNNDEGQTNVPAGLSNVSAIAAGLLHTCAVKTDGTLSCWGRNYLGQTNVPAGLSNVSAVAAGGEHTCALKADGTLSCWDWNYYGQTSVPAGLSNVSAVALGVNHTCALKADGTLSCWGNNDEGQTNVPAGLSNVSAVAAKGHNTCALKADGTLSCWGWNGRGQTDVPAGLSNLSAVAVGGAHTCALKTDGTLSCWGNNFWGQTDVPAGLSNVSAVAAGEGPHVCALKTDGTLRCWGYNRYGQTNVPAGLNLLVAPAPGATPVGSDIAITPIDQTTGAPAPVSISFDNVIGAGTTTVTSGTVGGTDSPAPPQGFRLGNPPIYYDIQTTASFTGTVTVCFTYSDGDVQNESKLRLLHRSSNGTWEDITTSLSTTTNTICGETTSLSPFIVGENLPPVVSRVLLPPDPVALGNLVTAQASFTDGTTEPHTGSFDWDGATSTASTVVEPTTSAAGYIGASHTYSLPGVYTIGASVSDALSTASRSSVLDNPAYVVVYDPTAGFVTGGGWINSPASACPVFCNGATGKATFGFVAKYARGANTPDGNTEFQFRAGDLNFKSTSYDWLVVGGYRAQYKGEGTINGTGRYRFLITAIDGALNNSDPADKFRIKITDLNAGGAVVYDNQAGEVEDSGSATQLGGGSIVIKRQ